MNELNVKKIYATHIAPDDVAAIMVREGVRFNRVERMNWIEFPYLPSVQFAIAHTGSELLLTFRVCEQSVRAEYGTDNGDVWNDSCVEFFLQFEGEKQYYNIECNCVGALLLGVGETRENRSRATADVTSKIRRHASLGNAAFGQKDGECSWEVSLVIPLNVFTRSQIDTLDSRRVRANFYKCGDRLPVPHFVSWNAISAEKPDFHRPDCFGTLLCEK